MCARVVSLSARRFLFLFRYIKYCSVVWSLSLFARIKFEQYKIFLQSTGPERLPTSFFLTIQHQNRKKLTDLMFFHVDKFILEIIHQMID